MRAALLALLVVASSCTSGGADQPAPSPQRSEVADGGTLRVGTTDLFTIDPHLGYSSAPHYRSSWTVLRCCLLRTLMSDNGLPADQDGGLVAPDLAERFEVSPDGLTWTFGIREGLRYAPPLQDVEITSGDVVRALERLARPDAVPGLDPDGYDDSYSFYYSVIEGFEEFRDGTTSAISGLETPDAHTLVMHLTEPTSDLGDRFALSATAPIPPNPYAPDARLGVADGHDFSYERFLVASGPYMIEGSGAVDFSLPPDRQQPASGFVPGSSLTLVRNPSWDKATDDRRLASPDRIEIVFGDFSGFEGLSEGELVRRIESGALDLILNYPVPFPYLSEDTIERLEAAERLVHAPVGTPGFAPMSLAEPPFDDVHVRRAVNLVVDKERVRRLYEDVAGMTGAISGHIAPDTYEAGLLAGYDPYGAPDGRGDVEAARTEMRRSTYDPNRDGRCDGAACRRVTLVARRDRAGPAIAASFRNDLRAIGIRPRVELLSRDRAFTRCSDEETHVGMCIAFAWEADYANGTAFFPNQFSSSYLECVSAPGSGCGNWSVVGATPQQLAEWGYETDAVPSADDRLERCGSLLGLTQAECWADLDRYLMEEIVPWVPLIVQTVPVVRSDRVFEVPVGEIAHLPSLDRIVLGDGEGVELGSLFSFGDHPRLPEGEPGIPDGVYTTAIATDDGRAVGLWGGRCRDALQDIGRAACLAGTYTLTVEDDRWVYETDSRALSCLNEGTGRSSGRVLRSGFEVVLLVDGCPAALTLRAALDGDRLTVQSLSGAIAMEYRVIFESHPWERIEA